MILADQYADITMGQMSIILGIVALLAGIAFLFMFMDN